MSRGRTGLFLVGAAPGKHPRHDPDKHALYPYPEGCAGHRMMLLMGLERREYVTIPRRNVIREYPGGTPSGDFFPMKLAREGAEKLAPSLVGHNVLFMGKRVAKAFGCDDAEFLEWHDHKAYNWAVFPHPSGRNRWFNDPDNAKRAREFAEALGMAHALFIRRLAKLQPVATA